MSNLAHKHVGYMGGNQPDEGDSWAEPVRMLYKVTITVRDPQGPRSFVVRVANYHNAEAIQESFDGLAADEPSFDGDCAIDVSIEPDVLGYLKLTGSLRLSKE